MLLDRTTSIARLTPTSSDTDKEQYLTVTGLEAVKMNIQPATAELIAVSDGAYGQTYQAFATVQGLRIGDQVTVSGSNDKYVIKGISDWNFPPIPHFELVLFKGDA